MKTTVLLTCTLLIALTLVLGGCQNLPAGFKKDATPGKTGSTVNNEMARTVDMDRQQFWDDVEKFMLLDRPTRLNELRIR